MTRARSHPNDPKVRLTALAEALRGLTAPFACGGPMTLAAPLELRLGRARFRFDTQRDELGRRLAKACPPAPFGVGGETRYDARVRHGRQLLARDGALEVEGVPLAELLEETRRALCPSDDSPPVAELHALNVYERGGRFVAHKDTPRDPAVFATLVVKLPVRFRGGRLVVSHVEGTRVFDWQERWFRAPGALTLEWAAFFGDVDHAIEEVTEGTRVTLTWDLRRSRGAVEAPPISATPFAEALREALADPAWLPRGGVLAVPCGHLYTKVRGLAGPGALDGASVGALKARDRLVAEAALLANLRASFRPYLFEDCAGESWRLKRDLSASDVAVFRRSRLGPSDVERLPLANDVSDDHVTWLAEPPWSGGARDEELYVPRRLVGEVEYSATGYFGNEGSDAAFYVAGALLIEIPASPRTAEAAPRHAPLAASIDLIVLACGSSTIRCRQLGTHRELTWRTTIRTAVPGTIVTLSPTKRGKQGSREWLSGRASATRFDLAALALAPLGLTEAGMWDPREELDRDDTPELPGWFEAVAARGPRPAFEMEPGSPGDLRDLDMHARLGAHAFGRDPAQAFRHFEVGAAIGELTLGEGFEGVLPWDFVDNRPYLRCLHGIGLSLWRLGEPSVARGVFVDLLWLNPGDHQGGRFCIGSIDAGMTWEKAAAST